MVRTRDEVDELRKFSVATEYTALHWETQERGVQPDVMETRDFEVQTEKAFSGEVREVVIQTETSPPEGLTSQTQTDDPRVRDNGVQTASEVAQ